MTWTGRRKATTSILNVHKVVQLSKIASRAIVHSNVHDERQQQREMERPGEKSSAFYVHEAAFSTPESLIPYIIFLWCCQFLLSLRTYIFRPATTSSARCSHFVHFVTRKSFSCDVQWRNMKMFRSFSFSSSLQVFMPK